MRNTCPEFKHIRDAHFDGVDVRIFRLLPDKKMADLYGIYANTTLAVSLKLLACHNIKNNIPNYCRDLHAPDAIEKICDYLKTKYVFLYVSNHSDTNSAAHLLAFVKASNYDNEKNKILEELYQTALWLGMSAEENIRCFIFQHNPAILDTTLLQKKIHEINARKPHSNFYYHLDMIPNNQKPQLLFVNGGFPFFSFRVQDALEGEVPRLKS
ncbi:hypothetical protein AGMMS49546_11890 [Spirochaetia bacterium]|nr:hypothetical protein AGMMS49546_11890 [Spirochaetia bacterium]